MPVYNFQGYKGSAAHRFTCPACMKPNRVRTFTVEHTVNPFNKNEDGSVRTSKEVAKRASEAAKLERDQFATEPLCATCENGLPSSTRREIHTRRRAALTQGERR